MDTKDNFEILYHFSRDKYIPSTYNNINRWFCQDEMLVLKKYEFEEDTNPVFKTIDQHKCT